MQRRQFLTTLILSPIAFPVLARAGRIPPVEFDAEDYAAVRFIATAEDPIRSVSVRVSAWADEEAAEAHRQATIDGAGSALPQGEFYQSEPVARILPPELSTLPATAVTWNTTAGVAAYRTEWVLLAARRFVFVWEILIGAGEPEPAVDLAQSLGLDLTSREHAAGSDLARLLPYPGQLPDGLTMETRMTPDGTFDSQGTPIPEASPEH